jgi:hypothetical protein
MVARMQRATSYGTLFSMRPDERGIRYVRPIEPLHFPSSDPEWEMSESHRHGRLCELLYDLLRRALPDEEACLGTDQFVYFDASNSRKKCAPDAFVKLGAKAEPTSVWLTWKRGAPELCIEILSPSDTKEKLTLTEKLRRFHAIGVSEVVAFDVDAQPGEVAGTHDQRRRPVRVRAGHVPRLPDRKRRHPLHGRLRGAAR